MVNDDFKGETVFAVPVVQEEVSKLGHCDGIMGQNEMYVGIESVSDCN